ncbi:MAG: Na/Pi cotransporter family protein [Leptospiraceae bacterium]|nr:Na/Pi cotransporter family protein [Leptospiraceae bacterium]
MQSSGELFILILTYIILFLHGLQGFSKELQNLGADYLNRGLKKVSSSRIGGFLFGAATTAVIQSSSAVTSITVAMVDAGVFTFRNSLPVLLGANIGTTATSWLVSYKLTGIGPVVIILGTFIGILPYRIRLIGNSLFYFGFILFSLDLISSALRPLQNEPAIQEILLNWNNPYVAALGGMIVTAIVQSSSVVSGMAILLHSFGFISVQEGIGIILGAIIGTTSTALIASTQFNRAAKLSAIVNFIFHFTGAVVLIPFIEPIASLANMIETPDDRQLALAHTFITLMISMSFIWFTRQIGDWVSTWRLMSSEPDSMPPEDPGVS